MLQLLVRNVRFVANQPSAILQQRTRKFHEHRELRERTSRDDSEHPGFLAREVFDASRVHFDVIKPQLFHHRREDRGLLPNRIGEQRRASAFDRQRNARVPGARTDINKTSFRSLFNLGKPNKRILDMQEHTFIPC